MAAPDRPEPVWLPFAFEARFNAPSGGAGVTSHLFDQIPARLDNPVPVGGLVARVVQWSGASTTWRTADGAFMRDVRGPAGEPVDRDSFLRLVSSPLLARTWTDYPLFDPEQPHIAAHPFGPKVVRGEAGVVVRTTLRDEARHAAERAASWLHEHGGHIARMTQEPVLQARHVSANLIVIEATDRPDRTRPTFRLDELDIAAEQYRLDLQDARRQPDVEIFDFQALRADPWETSRTAVRVLYPQLDEDGHKALARHDRAAWEAYGRAAALRDDVETNRLFELLAEGLAARRTWWSHQTETSARILDLVSVAGARRAAIHDRDARLLPNSL